MERSQKALELTVDGERFEVSADPDQPGLYHYAWLSGRHPGYGFSGRRSDHGDGMTAEHEEAIRSFLAQVNPVTGYID